MHASKSRDRHRSAISTLALSLTVSLCAQAFMVEAAQALSFISAKKSSLQAPMEGKLDSESGPTTDTVSGDASEDAAKDKRASKSKVAAKETARTSAKISEKSAKSDEHQSLAPVTLGEEAQPSSTGEAASRDKDDKQYMKLHAETMGIAAPKGPLDGDGHSQPTTLPSKSLKSEIGAGRGRLVDQAKNVNVMPMALMDSDAEADQKIITELDCERTQISDLWEATLTRSQDIQFVVQKLMPSSDRSHTTTALMRLISSTLVTGVSTAAMMSPSPMTYGATQAGSQMIMNIMGMADAKNARKAQIDQGQAITLYKMVRDTADKLTENYRDYKKHIKRLDRAQKRTEMLQNMIVEARQGQDAAKQIEMEYWVDKSKGDVEEATSDSRRYRQSLIDLAGAEAVEKLDQQFNDQMIAEQELLKKEKLAEPPQTRAEAPNAKPGKEKTPEQMQALQKLMQSQGVAGRQPAPNM